MAFEHAIVVGGRQFPGRYIVKYLERKGIPVREELEDPWPELRKGLVVWASEAPEDAPRLVSALEKKAFEAFIYLSSARVYENLEGVADESSPTESALGWSSPSGRSLTVGERSVLDRGGPRTRIARVSNIYSDALDGGSFVEQMIARALDGQGGRVETSPTETEDFVHIDDVCEAVWRIAVDGGHRIYNVASGETVEHQTVLGLLSERTGTPLHAAGVEGGRPMPTIEVGRLEHELGFRCRSLSDGLDRVLTWQDNQRAMRSMMGVTRMPWM